MSRYLAWLRLAIVLSTGILAVPSCSQEPGKPAAVSGASAEPDVSIVLGEPFLMNTGKTIENGTAYDRATLVLEKCQTVILPDTAEVRHDGEGNELEVFMKKNLHYGGHHPEPMSIRAVRKHMGCAVEKEGGALVLATFGEWGSKHGGTQMGVEVRLPKKVEVEKRPGLSGEESVGRKWGEAYLTKPKDAKAGSWYAPDSPEEGWKAIPDVPDPKRQAARAKYPPPPAPKPIVIPPIPKEQMPPSR